MTRTTMSLHFALVFAAFGISLPTLAPAPANAQNQNMEVIHHSNYDKRVHAIRARYQNQERKNSMARWHYSAAGLSRPSAQA